jgi:hypothetical protein
VKKKRYLLFSLLVVISLLGSSCRSSLPVDDGAVPTDYDCPEYTLDTHSYRTELFSDRDVEYHQTTVEDADREVGEHIPSPICLPDGFSIQEVYIAQDPIGYRWIIHYLISDEPVVWQGDQFTTKIVYRVYWVSVAPKRPDVDSISGKLIEEENDTVMLIWYQHGHLMELEADKDCPLQGLATIAGSAR